MRKQRKLWVFPLRRQRAIGRSLAPGFSMRSSILSHWVLRTRESRDVFYHRRQARERREEAGTGELTVFGFDLAVGHRNVALRSSASGSARITAFPAAP